ncbi:YqcC family protein [Siccibacter turicensis]|uniref:YqcC family protein n=1 Tax=Siccibacter turicensis TaxID=357233 RepID=A0A2P8VM95_9ENTR|nr:YqcC family protein [Siccibacter turicensis]MDY0969957.1 YqcC family protein [Siccibacter turicensis]PSN08666.1 YqcC family protein [Siccibacter turicensis]
MEHHNRIRRQLVRIEDVLREHQQWQPTAPDAAAFESTQPFCMDTLTPHEWLQWVLLPRMHAILDGGLPLPGAFAVAPYYEMALESTQPGRDALLVVLLDLDKLIAGDDA